MVRSVLPTCLLLGLALTACGGSKGSGPKIPQVMLPGPTAYDGTPPAKGSVTFVSTLPGGDRSKFVAYEVDPRTCAVARTIVGDLEVLQTFIRDVITNPLDDAGTATIIRPNPPPPPDGQTLVRDARLFASITAACEPSKPTSPTHQ